jgi:hypothetical protein
MCGYRLLKFFPLRELDDDFAAGFDSDYAVSVEFDFVGPMRPFGGLATRAHSIGSMNSAFRFGRDSSRVGTVLMH